MSGMLTLESLSELAASFKPIPNPFVELAANNGCDIESGNDLMIVPEQWIKDFPELEACSVGLRGLKISRFVDRAFTINNAKLMQANDLHFRSSTRTYRE